MLTKEYTVGSAYIRIYTTRAEMGEQAGKDAGQCIRDLLQEKDSINVMFAAAPSQNEVLAQLVKEDGIDWSRVNAFHMDEYIGIRADHPSGFANFLRRAIFSKLPFKSVNYIYSTADNPEAEAERYAAVLTDNPLDICVLGVGENGHIAFNDPTVADFNDRLLAKVVAMDERSRKQQVNDGCFMSIDEVPHDAITVTIPALVHATHLFCCVPGATKADAIRKMFTEDISTACPASILRCTANSHVYLDNDSGSALL